MKEIFKSYIKKCFLLKNFLISNKYLNLFLILFFLLNKKL